VLQDRIALILQAIHLVRQQHDLVMLLRQLLPLRLDLQGLGFQRLISLPALLLLLFEFSLRFDNSTRSSLKPSVRTSRPIVAALVFTSFSLMLFASLSVPRLMNATMIPPTIAPTPRLGRIAARACQRSNAGC
jgi:hypothetical protein